MGKNVWTLVMLATMVVGCGSGGAKDYAEAECAWLAECDSASIDRYGGEKECVKEQKAYYKDLYKSNKRSHGKKCAQAEADYGICQYSTADCKLLNPSCDAEETAWKECGD